MEENHHHDDEEIPDSRKDEVRQGPIITIDTPNESQNQLNHEGPESRSDLPNQEVGATVESHTYQKGELSNSGINSLHQETLAAMGQRDDSQVEDSLCHFDKVPLEVDEMILIAGFVPQTIILRVVHEVLGEIGVGEWDIKDDALQLYLPYTQPPTLSLSRKFRSDTLKHYERILFLTIPDSQIYFYFNIDT
jgi:hypothetical protein